jgi:hypothetical protein
MTRATAPASEDFRPNCSAAFPDHPLFAGIAPFKDYFSGPIEPWNDLLASRNDGTNLRFVAQTPALLADGLHYEERIARLGRIASRENDTHDAFNALMWLGHEALKRAMNARQVADIARVGPKQRTRGQCALTHFDEAGAIVWLSDAALVSAWNAHDWRTLFVTHRDAWGARIAVTIIGHALFDFALDHDEAPVAKALAVLVDADDIAERNRDAVIASWPEAEASIARTIAAGRWLADPQELRPLPLAGIPGWNDGGQSDDFYASAPCFRPLRPGRRYPVPSRLLAWNDRNAHVDSIAQAAVR